MDTAAAAALIWRHWQDGTRMAALPEALRPATLEQGYAIQAQLQSRSAAPLYGWKIAATSTAGQSHIGVSGPVAGRTLAEMVLPDGGQVSLTHNGMRLAEPEFAFRLARDLPPRATPYTMAEAMEAVASLHPAIEIPDTRFADVTQAGAAQIAAEAACGRHFILGPAAPEGWRMLDLAAHRVTATVGARYTRQGIGANVLGDPRLALAWIANLPAGYGVTLRAGQVVTTGTCMPPLAVEPGDLLHVDHGMLGSVTAQFVA